MWKARHCKIRGKDSSWLAGSEEGRGAIVVNFMRSPSCECARRGLSLVSPHLSRSLLPGKWSLLVSCPVSFPSHSHIESRAEAISKFRGKLSEGRIINEIRCIPDRPRLHDTYLPTYDTMAILSAL